MLRRISIYFLVLALFAPGVTSDTYPEWKARVFTTDEQGDSAVSGETANPAGDGVPNLLKYALGLDPHQGTVAGLPSVSLEPGLYGGALDESFLTLSWRAPSTNAPGDLYYVPEITNDLASGVWFRGNASIVGSILQFPDTPGDPVIYAAQSFLPLSSSASSFMRLRVLKGQIPPDDWQIANFGQTGIDGLSDADGDGLSNFQEFLNGTDPNDYYDGVPPEITVFGGDHQTGAPLSFLPSPVAIRLTKGGVPLPNAPVQFSVGPAGGLFGLSPADVQLATILSLRTDGDGMAAPFFKLPSQTWTTVPISVFAGGASGAMVAHSNGGHLSSVPTVSIVSGNNQEATPGRFLRSPLVVRLLGSNGQPVAGAQITFSVVTGGGSLVTDRFSMSLSPAVSIITNQEGLAWVSCETGAAAGGFSQVVAAADSESTQATFVARTVSSSPLSTESIATGAQHTVARYTDGTVWSWGVNARGQLGDGTTTDHWHRAQVIGLNNISAVSIHEQTSSALRSDGTVWTWGANDGYGLGNGESADSAVPVQVLEDAGRPLLNVVAIASGYWHHLALKSDGTVWAWGSDWAFQLGNDSEDDSAYALPVLLPNGTPLQGVTAVACGDDHSLALKADGTVWSWGYNGERELGTGYTGWRSATPQAVVGLTNVIAIAGGITHTLALKTDGTIWAWGQDSQGCIGDGTFGGTRAIPVAVRNLGSVIGIAAGASHSLALKSDGTVWAWGDNADGQLGPNSSARLSSDGKAPSTVGSGLTRTALPVQIAGLADVIGIAAGGSDSFAVTASAELMGWGTNGGGELGNHPQTNKGIAPLSVTDFRLSEDPDHDGLGTWKELGLGGNPDAYSTTGDSISDGWKALHNLSLSDPNLASSDPTNKGLTILQDFLIGTDPARLSTTGDGIADGWKVRYGLDPLNPNLAPQDPTGKGLSIAMDYQLGTDPTRLCSLNDGIADKWKIDHNVNPTDWSYGSRDDDGDGLSNMEEYAVGTDVTNPDSDSDGVADGADFWPTSKVFRGPRMAERGYALLDPQVASLLINNKGQIVFVDRAATLGSGTYFAQSISPDAPRTELQTGAFPGLDPNTGTRLRYGYPQPIALNDENNVISYCPGYYEWNPGVPGHTYPPTNGQGPYFFPADPGYFWFHNAYEKNALWRGGAMEELIWPATFASRPSPISINNGGSILFGPGRVIVWQAGVYADWGAGFGYKINNNGVVAGYRDAMAGTWNNGIFSLLGALGGASSIATSLNDAEEVVGYIQFANGVKHACAWKDQDKLDFATGAIVLGINSSSQMVGNASGLGVLWENGHAINLTSKVASSGWHVVNATAINDAGLITATAYKDDPRVTSTVLLIPMELMVDANRDGEISLDSAAVHNSDKTTPDRPYKFWTNDDQDAFTGTNTSEEIIPVRLRDNLDSTIQSIRDCEDLTRLHVSLRGMTDMFKTGAVKVRLRFQNIGSTSPSIRVFRAVTPGRHYLTNEGWAQIQASPPLNQAVATNGGTVVSSTTVLYLDPEFWGGVDEDNPVIPLLFEGVDEGKGELVIELYRNGQKIGGGGSVWLNIANIKQMYERAKGLPENIPAPFRQSVPFTGPVAFLADQSVPFERPWDESGDATVSVHGWNVSYDEYISNSETMFKRLWHQGYKGHFAAFRWDTRKSDWRLDTGDYNRSEHRAYVYGDALKSWVNILKAKYSRLSIVAHSMGNVVTGQALHDGMQVRNYLMFEAAVPVSCYDANAPNIENFWNKDQSYPTPDYHINPVTGERTLGYRGYLQDVTGAGIVTSFFNPSDWALATGSTLILGFNKQTNWETNQEDYKPDGEVKFAVHETWAYHYSPTYPVLERSWLDRPPYRSVSDSWEIKAFIARSRTKAAGAFDHAQPEGAGVGGLITHTINLRDQHGFGRERPDHSGQFTRNIQQVDSLYNVIRTTLEE